MRKCNHAVSHVKNGKVCTFLASEVDCPHCLRIQLANWKDAAERHHADTMGLTSYRDQLERQLQDAKGVIIKMAKWLPTSADGQTIYCGLQVYRICSWGIDGCIVKGIEKPDKYEPWWIEGDFSDSEMKCAPACDLYVNHTNALAELNRQRQLSV